MSVPTQPASEARGSVESPTDAKMFSHGLADRPNHPLAALVDALVQMRHGKSVDEVANQLEIPPAALGRWVSSLDALLPLNPDAEIAQFEDDELRRLRLENEIPSATKGLVSQGVRIGPAKQQLAPRALACTARIEAQCARRFGFLQIDCPSPRKAESSAATRADSRRGYFSPCQV